MGHEIRLVTETALRDAIKLSVPIVDCIELAFRQLSGGGVEMPPVLSMAMKDINAEVDVKTAYIPGLEGFAIKVSPGFFNNPSIGLPSLNGLMVLLSARTGQVLAVFLDNGYLTDVRTAAAGAVAARHLAPQDVRCMGVLGTGVQAKLQVQAAAQVRSFERVFVWGRDFSKAEQLANELANEMNVSVSAVKTADEAVVDSQLVVTTTPAIEPILSVQALHSCLHITAMGSDQHEKNEIDPRVLAAADLVVCDRISQCETMGELRSALQSGALQSKAHVQELGDIIRAPEKGRLNEEQITVCDLTGTGIQDTAIATVALQLAREQGIGTTVET
ncbi:MAG: cyclodeaminase [Rhodobacteraceae bacterium]|nr:cyclodeaminase [Paracoccaceae bacterium]